MTKCGICDQEGRHVHPCERCGARVRSTGVAFFVVIWPQLEVWCGECRDELHREREAMMGTTYKILRYDPMEAAWREEEERIIEAPGARSAVRTWAEKHGGADAGIFVAVPMRSWKPVNVEPATGVRISARP